MCVKYFDETWSETIQKHAHLSEKFKFVLLALNPILVPSVTDPLIDCATASYAQVSEPIGSLCVIVGLAPRVYLGGWGRKFTNLNQKRYF